MSTTTNLAITKLEVGQAQKEATINEALDLLDGVVAGMHSISTTGGTVTLTVVQAQKMLLLVTGTLGSNATIEIPVDAGKNRLWIVKNGTTGAFSLTVKKVGGTGVTVAQGKVRMLYYDGSDIAYAAPTHDATSFGGSVGSLDNRIVRSDGTGGATVQGSDVFINDNGDIGMGTTIPDTINDDGTTGANIGRYLAVHGNTSGYAAYFLLGGNIPGTSDRVGAINFFNTAMGGVDNRTAAIFSFNQGALGQGNLQFFTSPSSTGPLQRMEISYTGEVGIGHNAATNSSVRLQLAGMGTTSSTFSLIVLTSADSPYAFFRDDGKVFLNTTNTASVVAPASDGVFTVGQTGDFSVKSDGTQIMSGGTVCHQPVTPAQITSNQDNYNPGGKSAYYQRWSSDASRNITGLTFTAAKYDGQTHLIVNVGSQNIVLVHDATSTAANRFLNSTGADITLSPNQAAEIIYDATVTRWRVFKRN